MGVASKSTATSMRLYNGRDKYNEWVFVGTQASQAAGAPQGAGSAQPGGRGRGAQVPGRGGANPFGGSAPRPTGPGR